MRIRGHALQLLAAGVVSQSAVVAAADGAPTGVAANDSSLLSYTIAVPIKYGSCADDTDGDCLSQFAEDDLAWIAAPMLFFDEGEECAFGRWEGLHHYQVRPDTRDTGSVKDWQVGDGQTKRLRISYYFNWPLDCGHRAEQKHLGDSEHIQLFLSSEDMTTWTIDEAKYFSHRNSYIRMGSWLKDRADEIDADFLTVAVEDDKHGSWWGRAVDDQDCAGSEDNGRAGAIDCFPGMDWEDAFAAGQFEWFPTTRNIGEPPIQGGSLTTGGFASGGGIMEDPARPGSFYSWFSMPVGPSGREYWWNPPAEFSKFCGHLCGDWQRQPDGDCSPRTYLVAYRDSRSFSGCSSGLQEKIDTAPFNNDPVIQSCGAAVEAGYGPCDWVSFATCACDDRCEVRGDCCPDKQESCPFDPNSCEDLCGNMSTLGGCGCDYECMARGDCCPDFQDRCPDVEPRVLQGTCSGVCGFSQEECFCDHDCEARGDCCQDKGEECGHAIDQTPGSCEDFCGYQGGGCFCDADCMSRGDCCRDYQDVC